MGKPGKTFRIRRGTEEAEPEPTLANSPQPTVSVKKEEDPMAQYESLPIYARPYKNFKEGKMVVRPDKAPRTLMDIFMSPVNLEFFRRYMHHCAKDMPLLLWEAVEQMKQIKEAKTRHQHVSHTFRKFFLNRSSKCSTFLKLKTLV